MDLFENQQQLQIEAGKIVADMLVANVAEKVAYIDERINKEYFNLITPNAFDKDLITIAVLGYPERAGVWSFTLLSQSRIEQTSMEPYFREFASRDIGLIAIDPNFAEPDIQGDSFIYQLERLVAEIDSNKKIGLIGFSMGGKILVEFLEARPQLLKRVAGLALIDPTLPNRLKVDNIRSLLDNNTLLVASENADTSPGDIASVLLEIPKISFPGIHGQMPNKALTQVADFFAKRKP